MSSQAWLAGFIPPTIPLPNHVAMDFPNQTKPVQMTKINWTQTTTMVVASFVGCLAALLIIFFLSRYFLKREISAALEKLDELKNRRDEAVPQQIAPTQPVKADVVTPSPSQTAYESKSEKTVLDASQTPEVTIPTKNYL